MARFDQNFLDRIRDRVSLASLIGRKVSLKSKGRDHWACCPFHNEKTPSFKISEERKRYHCFGCGKDGDIFTYLVEAEGFTFPEAVERLAQEAGLELPKPDPKAAEHEARRKSYKEIMELATQYFEARLHSHSAGEAQNYLIGRGLSLETIKLYRLGYADGRLGAYLSQKGVSQQDMQSLCLIKTSDDNKRSYDFFRERIIFPICDSAGKVIAFGGRILKEGMPKYLNSADTPLFFKSKTLYGLHQARSAIHSAKQAIVCEGYMDVLSLAQAGFRNTVAPLGTALGEDHLAMLWRLCAEPIMCFDGDKAGQNAALRIAERALPMLEPGRSLYFLSLPQDHDPDDLIRLSGPQAFAKALEDAKPMANHLWNHCLETHPNDTPERQSALWQHLQNYANSIEHPDLRQAYWRQFRNWYEKAFLYPIHNQTSWQTPWHSPRQKRSKNTGYKKYPSPLYANRLSKNILKRLHNAKHKQIELVIAALINHPALIERYAEPLSALTLENKALKELLACLLDAALTLEPLDRSTLQYHLKNSSCDAYADTLLQGALREATFVDSKTEPPAVRKQIDHILVLIQENHAREEAKHSGHELAQELARSQGDSPSGSLHKVRARMAALAGIHQTYLDDGE